MSPQTIKPRINAKPIARLQQTKPENKYLHKTQGEILPPSPISSAIKRHQQRTPISENLRYQRPDTSQDVTVTPQSQRYDERTLKIDESSPFKSSSPSLKIEVVNAGLVSEFQEYATKAKDPCKKALELIQEAENIDSQEDSPNRCDSSLSSDDSLIRTRKKLQ